MFIKKKHNYNLYNNLLTLSRNIFFYKKIKLEDSFETRIYLMFLHFSIMMIVSKKKGIKLDQDLYDSVFHNIEYNLRELGFGDVSVNKKMKDLNKILYDILLKLTDPKSKIFIINKNLITMYFEGLKHAEADIYQKFEQYFLDFYQFCSELSYKNMIRNLHKFKN